MQPEIKKIKEIMQIHEYQRIPVYQEMLADQITPVAAMQRLCAHSQHCYLLESASQDGSRGRYSFLGYHPQMEITCQNGLMTIRQKHAGGEKSNVFSVKHPGDTLRKIIKNYHSPVMKELPPFTGGLVGYFAYDYLRYSEPKLSLAGNSSFKDLDLMLFNDVIAFDHYQQKIYLISGVMTDDFENSYQQAQVNINQMRDDLASAVKKEFPPLQLKTPLTPRFNLDEYCQKVERAKRYIHKGDIFQMILSNPLQAQASGSLFDTYRILRASNPSPYMFYFASDDLELAGASPETLARVNGCELSTFPLAGTRRRGRTPAEDQAMAKELQTNKKELAEHNMLVDLGRNDLGKVSRIGTIHLEKYLQIQYFSQVMHLGSTIKSQLSPDHDAIDVVDAVLPAGTLSGAPKFRACQIIEELEQDRRGVYGGGIGYLDFAGNLDICIAIRFVSKQGNQLGIRSGAGIVADSVPHQEFKECQNKARAVKLAVLAAEGGLEN